MMNQLKQAAMAALLTTFAVTVAPAGDREIRPTVGSDRSAEEAFYRYQDPDGLFQMILPRTWRTQRSVSRKADGSVELLFQASHPAAATTGMADCLASGIRIRLVLPPQGRVWSADGMKDLTRAWIENRLAAYDNVTQATEPEKVTLTGRDGVAMAVVGSDRSLPIKELVTLIAVPSGEFVMGVEISAPVTETELFKAMHLLVEKSFRMGE
jgi:hypothetical protein